MVVILVFIVPVAMAVIAVIAVIAMTVVIEPGPSDSVVIAVPIRAGLDDAELPLNSLRSASH